MSYSDRYSDLHTQRYYRKRTRAISPLAMLGRIAFFALLLFGAAMGGLWLLGAVIGLSLGILGLLLALSPIIFVVWVLWLIFKAIIL
ncbi:hypothetical protein [Reinekea sp.]|jgi:uncharacterized membrane protein|uniref:hypothetical protein n=1 Tax=Reinekea sp. TaxID=1970455 RepID=UPI00398A270B